jgi:hypothetical protein
MTQKIVRFRLIDVVLELPSGVVPKGGSSEGVNKHPADGNLAGDIRRLRA